MMYKVCNIHGMSRARKRTLGTGGGWECISCRHKRKRDNHRRNAQDLIHNLMNECCEWTGCRITDMDMLTNDHVPELGNKLVDISQGQQTSVGMETLQLEMLKTWTLCANHHLKVTRMRERGESIPYNDRVNKLIQERAANEFSR